MNKKSGPKATASGPDANPYALPSREQILEALRDQPDLSSKRDLARYFNIKSDTRVAFKQLLKQLEGEGLIARQRKTLRRTSDLPSVAVLDILSDGDPDELIAVPNKWDEKEGPAPRVAIITHRNDRVFPGPGERVLAKITRTQGGEFAYSARTIKILGTARKAQIGIIRRDDNGARLVPVDRKQKEMRVQLGDLEGANDGDLVEVEVKTVGRLMVPQARVVKVLGNPQSEGAISLIALHNLDIPYRFPQNVERAAKDIQTDKKIKRKDWRHIPFVTIDPETAKDHDDAVFAEADEDPKNSGGFIIYIAIADVAAYVRAGGELDVEAIERGNSVYFPDRVVPMLPERISNDLCSLREGENRPAMALRLIIDKTGKKKSHTFHRVTMKSAAKLSYQQAQNAIDGHTDDQTGPLLANVLEPLFAAYKAMCIARDKRNPLALDLPERRIQLDNRGMVSRVYVPDRLDAHKLIEEMMIAANVCAAETLELHKLPVVYRIHDAPGREKLVALREFLTSLGLSLIQTDAIRPNHFNTILNKVSDTSNAHQVSEMVLRTQARAEYNVENLGHFGLNLDRYAHFTSPIRRYADLLVHRALISALDLGDDGLSEEEMNKLSNVCQHISFTERRAMAAERETQDRLIAHHLAAQIGATFAGRISGVTKSGLFVRLNETGADGFIPASTLGKDYFHYSESEQAMIGERSGETFRLGDEAEVRLLEAAPTAGALRFEVLSNGSKGKPAGRKRSGANPRKNSGKKRQQSGGRRRR